MGGFIWLEFLSINTYVLFDAPFAGSFGERSSFILLTPSNSLLQAFFSCQPTYVALVWLG
jgi:hypothetical protein